MSVRGNGPHVLFYSNKCNWCKAFIEELKQTPFVNQFKYVCCDPSPSRGKLPSFLKEVPTIVIAGDPEPKVTNEAFNWLSFEKMKVNNSKQKTTNSSDPTPESSGEPDAWNPLEFTSFSKGLGYSFNDSDTSTAGSGGFMIPGAFQFLGGNSSTGVRNANDIPGKPQQGRQKSKKEEMYDKQLEQYKRDREEGMPQARPRV